MPIVMRFWTYQKNVDFIAKCDGFLRENDKNLIMGDTVAKRFGVD